MRGWINQIRCFSRMYYVVTLGDVIQTLSPTVKLAPQQKWLGHEQL